MTNYNKIIKNFWDKQVQSFYKDTPSEYLYNFFTKARNKKSKKVLDIGCGAGRNTIMMHKLGFIVYGCDLNKKMVLATKKRLPVDRRENIIVSNMLSLPYQDNYFDFIVSNGVFHNASNFKDFCLAVKEGNRVLKEGGYFVLNTFAYSNLKNEFTKSRKEKYLYFTKDNLPIILLPISELINILSENSLKLLSFEKNYVTVNIGKRKIFKGIFLKVKKREKDNLPLINLRFLIDKNDKNILNSILERIGLVRRVSQYKKKRGLPFSDYKREKEIKDNLLKFSNSAKLNLSRKMVEEITDFLFKISKKGAGK